MSLESHLAQELMRAHPERAAAALERVGIDEALRVLSGAELRDAAEVTRRLSPQFSAGVLEGLALERAAAIFESLALDVSSLLLRRLDPSRTEAILERLPGPRARALRSLLRFPENSAGALLDPDVLALPEDLTAREALERVRATPLQARYNLYVVDRDQKLVGVLNLRELFLARPQAPLCDLMIRHPVRLEAGADRSVVVGHPGWKDVHSIPVVDEHGAYLGAIRYRTLRTLEEQLFGKVAEDEGAPQALGELFAAGVAGLIDALTAGSARKGGR